MKLLITVIFADLLLISVSCVGGQECKVTRNIPCNELETSVLPGSSQKGVKGDRGFPGKAGPRGYVGDVGPQGQQGDTGPMPNMDSFVQEMKALVQVLNTSFMLQLNEMKAKLQELAPSHCWTFHSDGILITKNGEKLLCSSGWTVFQRRIDGRIADFHQKTWEEYANGFGEVDGEFWLGLRKLHWITSQGGCRLRVDLSSWDNETAYAEYSHFSVANEANLFRVELGGYSGTAGDSLTGADHTQNKMAFSTVDRDNDKNSANCAGPPRNGGGWWHKSCGHATPNAIYGESRGTWNALVWYHWKKQNALKSTMLKVRCN